MVHWLKAVRHLNLAVLQEVGACHAYMGLPCAVSLVTMIGVCVGMYGTIYGERVEVHSLS